ncbi:MAG: glycosyltransferase family 2 protein [Comamonas sp.]|uniref:glycosyltransferase family 2 protein n=1 Tax=Comamonas sp. TaxID=34028 RepID=UPI002FC845E8
MLISLVVPVFNEEDAVPIFHDAIKNNKELGAYDMEIIFVNDGSTDNTVQVVKDILTYESNIKLISFSRNFGKEPALFAGLQHARGDVVIPIDVDLQDPIEVIPRLIEKHLGGAEVVLAKRVDRVSDSWMKRRTAEAFYWVHNKISKPKIESNVGDFRLMSRKVVNEIIKLEETQLFMKGILSWVGFKTDIVEYAREKRVIGDTKFNAWKLWNLAVEGITSFSTVPLKIWTYMGLIISLLSFLYAIAIVIDKLLFGNAVSGYSSIMVSLLFLGGVQLIGIGVLGEYVGRIYMESKKRPRYIIADVFQSEN